MLKKTQDLYILGEKYIQEFNTFCTQYGLIGKVQADHICVKCSDTEIFESQRKMFEFDSKYIYQSIISKRRIAIVGLQVPIKTIVGDINYLELSDQKLDDSQDDRIDHIEVVPTTVTYDEILVQLQKNGVVIEEVIRPHHTTHDIYLESGFIIRLSQELLINKVKREEMM